jgi:hypothetical protein
VEERSRKGQNKKVVVSTREKESNLFFFLFQFQAEKKLEVGRVNSLFSQGPLLYSAMYFFFFFFPFQKEREREGREKPRKAEWCTNLSLSAGTFMMEHGKRE